MKHRAYGIGGNKMLVLVGIIVGVTASMVICISALNMFRLSDEMEEKQLQERINIKDNM